MDEESVFAAAVEKSSPSERAAFLDQACAGDRQLLAQVEALLRAHDNTDSFLERPILADQQTQDLAAATDHDDPPGAGCPAPAEISLVFLEPCDAPDRLGKLGPYEVLEVIGRGGMGLVLKAHDPQLNRIVAIKTLAPELAALPTARKRFLREAQAAAAVSHPHVVTIHAVDEAGNTPYLVMEYIDGLTLQEKIDRVGTLELREILRIGTQVAAGLAAAHAQGLIHRDVKPGNVLLENGVERVRVSDFGLARAIEDVSVTRTGEVAGTPQHMSPEQAQGQPLDQRSDLFSLGSVLYAMCTGRSPFRAETAVAAMRRVCDDTPRPIREINPEIPEGVAAIIDRLLAKDPDDRFQTAREVADLLGRYLAHLQHPASTPPPEVPDIRQPADATLVVAPRVAAARRWTRQAVLIAATVLVGLCISVAITEATGITHFAATILRITTGAGTLVVEVDEPDVSVTIDGEDLVITGAGPREVRLMPGQYRVQATKDGRLVTQELVTIQRGGRQVLRVALEPSAAPRATGSPAPQLETPPSDFEVRRYVGHTAGVECVCVSADGKRILSGGDDRTVRLWDLETGAELRRFEGHSQLIRRVAVLPDGRRLASGSFDRTVRIWDAETGKASQTLTGHEDQVWDVAALPDGKRVISASLDKTLRVWDVGSGEQVGMLELDQPVCSVAALPDGRHVLCGDKAGVLQLWDLDKASLVRRLEGHTDYVKGLAVSPDGTRALSAGATDGTVRLWDLETGEELHRFEGHGSWAQTGAFSRDGKLALTCGHTKMFLWDLDTRQKLRTFKAPSHFPGVAFVPDGLHAVSAAWHLDRAEAVRLWELPESVWPEQAVLDRLAQVSKSIEADPMDAKLPAQRGRLYVRLGRYDEAARDFIRANDLLASPWGWDATSGVFDSLMQRDEVFHRIAELRPDDLNLWTHRGHYYALRGQWERALPGYARASEEPLWQQSYACALLLTGDEESYRRVCGRLVQRFAKTDDPEVAYKLAIACSLSPRSGVDPARIVEWAGLGLNGRRDKFRLGCLASARLRAGQFDQAVTLLQEAMDVSDGMAKSRAAFPLALAYRGLGQHDESRKWYAIGVSELRNATPRDPDDAATWAPSHWLDVNVWYRQAKAVFGPLENEAPAAGDPQASDIPEEPQPVSETRQNEQESGGQNSENDKQPNR